MTFNWPTTGFTGTEVEAFETAYKELAEAIYTEYGEYIDDETVNYYFNIVELKTPYQWKQNIKIFLEQGFLYASFIVKQRAGNSGNGTDFDLGSSPYYYPNRSSEAKANILKAMGCIAEKKAIESCYDENQAEDPDGILPRSDDVDDIIDLIAADDPNEEQGQEPKCEDFLGALTQQDQKQQEDPTCLTHGIADVGWWIAQMMHWSLGLQYGLVGYYLKGEGGQVENAKWNWIGNGFQFVRSGLGFGPIDLKTRTYTRKWMAQPRKMESPQHRFEGYTHKLISEDATSYGVPGGRVWVISSSSDTGFPNFKNILGDYTVVTDGNETYAIDSSMPQWDTIGVGCSPESPCLSWDTPTGKAYITSISDSNIKQIRDDYDFDYGFEIRRTTAADGNAGDAFNDEQIESGPLFENPTTTPCEASDNTAGMSGVYRRVVANNHGTGRTERGEYFDENCKGKPFAIKLSY